MKIKQQTKTKGFTIIEVVLVLAIAGLIFMMVFFALPALQKSQRDTQRKNDLARIMTQLTNYSTTNRGAIPNDSAGFLGIAKNYLGGSYTAGSATSTAGPDYVEPTTGTGYLLSYVGTGTSNMTSPAIGTVYYNNAAKCDTDGATTADGAVARNFVLRIQLEGQTALYCLGN